MTPTKPDPNATLMRWTGNKVTLNWKVFVLLLLVAVAGKEGIDLAWAVLGVGPVDAQEFVTRSDFNVLETQVIDLKEHVVEVKEMVRYLYERATL